jgi:hypothetical protein
VTSHLASEINASPTGFCDTHLIGIIIFIHVCFTSINIFPGFPYSAFLPVKKKNPFLILWFSKEVLSSVSI